MSYIEPDYRQCSVCKKTDVVYRFEDGSFAALACTGYVLMHYSTRRYAHKVCLIKKFGEEKAKEMTPEHQWRNARSATEEKS